MSRKAIWMVVSILMVTIMVLTACTPPAATPIVQTVMVPGDTVVVKETVIAPAPTTAPVAPVAGKKILRMEGGETDIPSIDPSHSQGMTESQLVETNFMGLYRQNEQTTEMEKGMATGYTVSDDGMTYTFTLMENIPWVKYDAVKDQVVKVQDCEGKDRVVTADDFAFGILRTLDPKTASEYAYVLTPYLVGADEYNSSEETDEAKLAELRAAVGVKVIDPKTIAYTFKSPAVYNLNIIGLWVAHAQPKWLIEGDDCTDARGERWTENGFFQSYGTYTLKEWIHDSILTLAKNPFWPGTSEVPQAKIDEIQYYILSASAAFAEFEAGNLDIASIPSGDHDRITTDPVYKDMITQTNTLGTEWYAFNTKKEPTDDVRVRMALSLAIDRESLLANVVKSGVIAPFFTNPGAAGAPKPDQYPDLGVKYDPAQAKALLDEYLKEKGKTADALAISLMYNTSQSNKQTAEAIQAMWKEVLGLNVNVLNQERKVFYAQRPLGNENVYRSSWVQDYPDTNNFLYEVFGPGGGFAEVVKWDGDPYTQFVDLLKQGAVEKDPAKRMDVYAQAEKLLVADQAVLAPLYWYATPILVRRPDVKDIYSKTGYDHYEKWDIVRP